MAGRLARALSVLVPLLAASWTWHPLLGAAFYADDFIHLFDLVTLGVPSFLTQTWAGHLYLVRNSVFLGMFELFGPTPRPFFWSVLLTHLVNVLLLHRVIRRLGGGALLAAVGATMWGTCPTLEGALGWYSVYGQVLLTTFLLVVLGQLAGLVAVRGTLTVRAAVAWGVLLALGAASFGIGIGIAAVFPVAVAIALPASQRARGAVGVLTVAALLTLAVYAAMRVLTQPHLDPSTRSVLSSAAMLAELPRAATLTVELLLFGAYTLPFGALGLRLDAPATVEIVASVTALVVLGAFAADAAIRRWLFALGLLAVVAYGTVAVGRTTSLEALNVQPTQAAAWPRYHYCALALLTIAGCTALVAVQARGRAATVVVRGVALAWTAACLVLLVTRPREIELHSWSLTETERTLAGIRAAVAATPRGGVTVIPNEPFVPAAVPWLFPGTAGLFVIAFPDDTVDGRIVRFQANDDDWRLAQARGGRIAALVQR